MVNVELAQRRASSTVLTLMRVAKHQVATSQANGRARNAVVPEQMDNAWNSKPSADDGELVVVSAYWKVPPELEIVRVPVLVECEGAPTIKKNNRTLDRGHLNGTEVPIEDEHGEQEWISHRSVCGRKETRRAFERLSGARTPSRMLWRRSVHREHAAVESKWRARGE
jgi:hypothetical protein